MSERKDYEWDTVNDRLTALEATAIANLRDFFATSALSMLARENTANMPFSEIAKTAYHIADVMMLQRKKGHNVNSIT